jgi:two-component system cell cycle sensor histidine kinase/response regulator CckA
LLVDDDEAVRAFTRRVLAAQGYAVFEASSGTEALALTAANAAEIDLLVTDLVMPGLDGRTLAEQLRSSRQDLPVLYVSGFPGNHLDKSALASKGVDFLPKPYSADAIVRAVRSVLDEMP